jgi:hypothetical protein
MEPMNTSVNALTRWLRGLGFRPPAEKREAPRRRFDGSIEVRTTGGTVFRGVARDLSARGMGAIVYADLKVGDSVVVNYAHPSKPASEIVRRSANVRGRFGSRYGFEFADALSA